MKYINGTLTVISRTDGSTLELAKQNELTRQLKALATEYNVSLTVAGPFTREEKLEGADSQVLGRVRGSKVTA